MGQSDDSRKCTVTFSRHRQLCMRCQGRITQVNVQRVGAASEVLLNEPNYHPFGLVADWTC